MAGPQKSFDWYALSGYIADALQEALDLGGVQGEGLEGVGELKGIDDKAGGV